MQFRVPVGLGQAPVQLLAASGWSVKAYTVGGKTVWGSYQSPATNAAIIELQKTLTKFGIPCNTDGLISLSTLMALNELVRVAAFIPNDRLASGDTVGDVVGRILTAGGKPFVLQQVAQNGGLIRAALQVLASNSWFVNTAKNLATHSGGNNTPPTTVATKPPKTPAAPPTFPDPIDAQALVAAGGTDNRTFFEKYPKAPYAIGGGVLAAGLLAATLYVWFAPAHAGGMHHDD